MQTTPSPSEWASLLAPFAHNAPFLPVLLLGIGLAASSGLRAFLPLFALALAFHFGFAPAATGHFAWLGSPVALGALGIAALLEVAGDKIPAVDHALDSVGTIVRPAMGALAAGAVLNTHDPATGALLGLIVGAPIAFGMHGAKATTRGASSVTTLGLANPVVSVLEDVAALLTVAAAFFIPILVPLLLLIAALVGWKLFRAAKVRLGKRAVAG